jgi:NADP-dependent 3-hydroxy acid dehydrogenase YdfG
VAERVLLITGASGGIGAATARRASAAGFRLALAARNRERLDALIGELAVPDAVIGVTCDVTDWATQQRLIASALDKFGRLDAVFANAGVGGGSTFLGGEDTPDAWRAQILTNIYGTAATARLSLPALVESRGHLILTGSVVGRVAVRGSLYSATKWAVTGLAAAIRAEVVGTGVRVTLIAPGMVDTAFFRQRPQVPMLQPDDVAAAVLYALQQPPHVDVNEVLIRPVGQAT